MATYHASLRPRRAATGRIALALVASAVLALGCDADGGSTSAATPGVADTGTRELEATTSRRAPVRPSDDDALATSSATAAPLVADACDLTEPVVVANIFGGTVLREQEGAFRNCAYAVQGGTVESVDVFYYGPAAEWGGVRSGYESNRGPLTVVTGVGHEAFTPADAGSDELVVLAGDVVFAVAAYAPGSDAGHSVAELGSQIAAEVG